jgi:hypothetical protein
MINALGALRNPGLKHAFNTWWFKVRPKPHTHSRAFTTQPAAALPGSARSGRVSLPTCRALSSFTSPPAFPPDNRADGAARVASPADCWAQGRDQARSQSVESSGLRAQAASRCRCALDERNDVCLLPLLDERVPHTHAGADLRPSRRHRRAPPPPLLLSPAPSLVFFSPFPPSSSPPPLQIFHPASAPPTLLNLPLHPCLIPSPTTRHPPRPTTTTTISGYGWSSAISSTAPSHAR